MADMRSNPEFSEMLKSVEETSMRMKAERNRAIASTKCVLDQNDC